MRKLQVLRCFGGIYTAVSTPGSLALFCTSCLQPGINLPVNWKELPSWVTHRTVTVDANFYADHIRMHQSDLDIMLMDGQEGYMVEEVRFKEYLSVAKKMHGVNLD
jgi:hypothetical protein